MEVPNGIQQQLDAGDLRKSGVGLQLIQLHRPVDRFGLGQVVPAIAVVSIAPRR
jgi:hypothetical protein